VCLCVCVNASTIAQSNRPLHTQMNVSTGRYLAVCVCKCVNVCVSACLRVCVCGCVCVLVCHQSKKQALTHIQMTVSTGRYATVCVCT